MTKDFQKIVERAVAVRNKYAETDPKEWQVEQVFMGMVKDVGNLSKLLMVNGGWRDDIDGDAREKLKHELADVLYSLCVIADKLDIDLEESFHETMGELEKRFD